jgi:hypothetical protein
LRAQRWCHGFDISIERGHFPAHVTKILLDYNT